jgi:hypothetical protein
MIDISNKSVDELNALITTYKLALEQVYETQTIPFLAVVFDIAVPYIKERYPDLSTDAKTCGVYVLKLLLKYLKNEADIKRVVDEFFAYHKINYPNYGNDIELSASSFDRDYDFVYKYALTRKAW